MERTANRMNNYIIMNLKNDIPQSHGQIPTHDTGIYLLKGERRLLRKHYEAECAFLSRYQELYNPEYVGSAYYAPHAEASGGMVVRNIGLTPSNDIIWENVNVDKEGSYSVSFKVFGDKPVEMIVYANDGEGKKLSIKGNPDGEIVNTQLNLVKGDNIIRLASREKAPDIDYMSIDSFDTKMLNLQKQK